MAGSSGCMDNATLAIWLGRCRIAIGVVIVVAPRFATKRMSANHKAEGVEPVFARMLGARDIALGLGTVLAVDKGTPVRGWLEGAALADTADCVSAALGHRRLSARAVKGTVALAGASAVAGALLARRLDPAPAAHPGQPEAVVTGHHA